MLLSLVRTWDNQAGAFSSGANPDIITTSRIWPQYTEVKSAAKWHSAYSQYSTFKITQALDSLNIATKEDKRRLCNFLGVDAEKMWLQSWSSWKKRKKSGTIINNSPVERSLGDIVFHEFLSPAVKRQFLSPQAVVMASDLPHTASTLLLIKANQRRPAPRWRPNVMRPDVSSDKARLCLTAMKWVIKACLSKLIYCTLFISMSRGPLCLSDVVFWAGFFPSCFLPSAKSVDVIGEKRWFSQSRSTCKSNFTLLVPTPFPALTVSIWLCNIQEEYHVVIMQ